MLSASIGGGCVGNPEDLEAELELDPESVSGLDEDLELAEEHDLASSSGLFRLASCVNDSRSDSTSVYETLVLAYRVADRSVQILGSYDSDHLATTTTASLTRTRHSRGFAHFRMVARTRSQQRAVETYSGAAQWAHAVTWRQEEQTRSRSRERAQPVFTNGEEDRQERFDRLVFTDTPGTREGVHYDGLVRIESTVTSSNARTGLPTAVNTRLARQLYCVFSNRENLRQRVR